MKAKVKPSQNQDSRLRSGIRFRIRELTIRVVTIAKSGFTPAVANLVPNTGTHDLQCGFFEADTAYDTTQGVVSIFDDSSIIDNHAMIVSYRYQCSNSRIVSIPMFKLSYRIDIKAETLVSYRYQIFIKTSPKIAIFRLKIREN